MRRFVGVVMVSVILSVAVVAQARVSRDRDVSWIGRVPTRVMQILKRLMPQSLGDGMTIPRP